MINYFELSKEISYALRHAPWEYELEMDNEGWVSINQLLNSLRCSDKWNNIVEADLRKMISASKKKRHEISNGKIRAFYGHSIPLKIQKVEQKPPDILYHGTAGKFVDSIMANGLLPKTRQYVHLSQDIETATTVGKRRDENPIILQINALEAYNQGIKFYYGNEKVWLTDSVPERFIIMK